MKDNIEKNPKLFISYSWSSPEHEKWVLSLATELRSNGVDVLFDKWDLKEGDDDNSVSLNTSIAFRKAKTAIQNNDANAQGTLIEYFDRFTDGLHKFYIKQFGLILLKFFQEQNQKNILKMLK